AYLASKGADTVNLDRFRTLQGSRATGAESIGRLTNLMELTVDTSWYTRYRSRAKNPDLDPAFAFPQAIPGLATGRHPAIPRTDDDLSPDGHIQAIANTAAFHFVFIEQGGTSLYPSLAQRVSDLEVLRILLSIGPTETAHFQTWHDKAGNAVNDPLAPLTDPNDKTLVFPNLNITPGGEDFQTNLIMPEPCPFLSRKFPVCSIIRPTATQGAAMGALKALTQDGLFIGQSREFFELLRDLAEDADEAKRES
ncbi:MAG: ferritin-like domain-containing protein, partial [Bryobacteraceae bacterium]